MPLQLERGLNIKLSGHPRSHTDGETTLISIPTVFERKLHAAVPVKSAWLEAWGFVLMGVGCFLALACYSFNPYDYTAAGVNVRGVTNLAGPLGAAAAAHILGRFGVIGMVWPIAITFWGALTVTGFVLWPQARRVIGLLILAADFAGFAEVLLPRTGFSVPSFGFGGIIGRHFHRGFMPQLGFGGTLTALAVVGFVGLVLSGNLRLSQTASVWREGLYYVRRFFYRLYKRMFHNNAKKVSVASMHSASSAGSSSATPARARSSQNSASAPQEPYFDMELSYDGPAHGKPDASLFSTTKKAPDQSDKFRHLSAHLVEQLAQFKIHGEITDVTQGPVVTTFEFKPAAGTKVSKISAVGEDLARMLKAQSLRVLAPIPGKDTVGFEVPNSERAVIGFAELLASQDFRASKRKLPIAMGVDIFGNAVVEDLAEMPHLLVAGSTGAGKSVFMNTLIGSLIARHSASTLRLVMIDPKMVEMAAYNDLPHMACKVITDPAAEARLALGRLIAEMDERYRRMQAVGARNIDSFNEIIRTQKRSDFLAYEGKWSIMPYIVLIIDEMADMMMLLGKEIETPITRLAQKSRACGIHMVIATQRPSADVVTGLIKANFPTRVAFRVMSGIDSRTILDQNGAETLLGKGDMIYLAAGKARRLHGAYLAESEVQSMVKAAKAKKK